jgi:hypothetical protein
VRPTLFFGLPITQAFHKHSKLCTAATSLPGARLICRGSALNIHVCQSSPALSHGEDHETPRPSALPRRCFTSDMSVLSSRDVLLPLGAAVIAATDHLDLRPRLSLGFRESRHLVFETACLTLVGRVPIAPQDLLTPGVHGSGCDSAILEETLTVSHIEAGLRLLLVSQRSISVVDRYSQDD